MPAQSKHGLDPVLAVFERPEKARPAVRLLSELVADPGSISVAPLSPGRYKLADINRAAEARAALRGAVLGAPIGAVVGLALAAALGGVGPFAVVGGTASGALAGFVYGGLRALARTRWRDTGFGVLEAAPGTSYTLVIVPPSATRDDHERAQAIRTLERYGAIAFLAIPA
jgi:hypothetical protein